MNNPQRNVLDAGNRVKVFNIKHEEELSTIEEYAAERKIFNDAMAIANSAAQAQTVTAGASATASDTAKQAMASTVIKYALRAAVKAKQLGNHVLAVRLDHSFTYLSYATKTLAVHRAKEIRDMLKDNLSTLSNINAPNIAEIDNTIDAYDSIKDMPTIDIQTKAANGTNALPAALATATHAMDNMYDLVFSYFMDTNRPLVDELALAKQIITTGVHHNGLGGTITKSGLPIFGASILIAGTDKIAMTDKAGHYIFSKVKTGDQTITATHPDGNLQTKTASISKAHVETVDFDF